MATDGAAGPKVIYEVNLRVNADIEAAFLDWLRPHMKEMLTFPGFESASLCKRQAKDENAEEDPSKVLFTAQYMLASRQHLEQYITEHAPAMRGDGLKTFPPSADGVPQFVAQRRVLEVMETM
eukprot:TRINITY_DN17062_c0_g1_i1.p1 TRINITY_DN17062_c0_g1~~TRINITY_DN17062_c0_g1_i1.p1  ORF type:complete len:123 (-),score=44.92 TRINITY_DN17062_c0_g1_i1:332-700(-)